MEAKLFEDSDCQFEYFTQLFAKRPNTCHGRPQQCTNEKSTPPRLSSFGICAGFLFVFLSLLSLQSALSRHSVQDIWELDKPQTLGNESFIQKVFKLWRVWHHVRNKAISRAILLSPSDWFARDAEVSKSGDDRLGKLAPVLISTLLNSLCRLEGQIFRRNWNS